MKKKIMFLKLKDPRNSKSLGWVGVVLVQCNVNVYFYRTQEILLRAKLQYFRTKVQLFSGFPDSIKIRNLFSIISQPLALVSTNQSSAFCHVINLDHLEYRLTRSEVKDWRWGNGRENSVVEDSLLFSR